MQRAKNIAIFVCLLILSSAAIQSINALQNEDDAGESEVIRQFQIPYSFYDAVNSGSYIYGTVHEEKLLVQFDLDTGFIIEQWEFDKTPGVMWLTDSGNTLYVALMNRPFQYFSNEAVEEGGTIVVFDMTGATPVQTHAFEIDIDPFDLVGSDHALVITGGSGQHTTWNSYDKRGNLVSSIRESMATRISLSPDEDIIYYGTTVFSPREYGIIGFNRLSGEMQREGRGFGLQNHDGGQVFEVPSGHIVAETGEVYLSTGEYVTDIGNVRILSHAIDPTNGMLFIVEGRNYFSQYNLATFVYVGHYVPGGEFVFLVDTEGLEGLYVVDNHPPNRSVITQIANPAEGSAGNATPIANFHVSENPNTSETTIFNASASSDDSGIHLYIWSFNGREVARMDNPIFEYDFTIGGTYSVDLVVEDHHGEQAEVTHNVNIAAPIPSPGAASTETNSNP